MKRLIAFILIISIIGLMGCSDPDEERLTIFKEYKTAQFKVEDYEEAPTPEEIEERINPYVTDEALAELKENNKLNVMLALAESRKKNISMKNAEFSNKQENDDGSISYEYELLLDVHDDSASENFAIVGEVTFIEKGGKWKVSRDVED